MPVKKKTKPSAGKTASKKKTPAKKTTGTKKKSAVKSKPTKRTGVKVKKAVTKKKTAGKKAKKKSTSKRVAPKKAVARKTTAKKTAPQKTTKTKSAKTTSKGKTTKVSTASKSKTARKTTRKEVSKAKAIKLENPAYYFFGGGKADGKGDMKDLLGGKGAGLAEMSRAKIPVPPGFTITTEVCAIYYENDLSIPDEIDTDLHKYMAKMEKLVGAKFGDPGDNDLNQLSDLVRFVNK